MSESYLPMRPVGRVLIAAVIRDHSKTTGMAVAMGQTCRCGAWLRGDAHVHEVPRWVDDLAQHQADEIIKALAATPAAEGDDRGRGAV